MQKKIVTNKSTTGRTLTVRRILRSRAFTIFAAIGIIVIGISLTKQIIRKVEISRQIADLESEIQELEQQNSELNMALEYFNSSAFQEKEARQKLGLKTEGETVVMLPNDYDGITDSGTIDVIDEPAQPALSNPAKWQQYFFN